MSEQVVELVSFKAKEGVTVEQMAEASKVIEPVLKSLDGFVYRSVVKGDADEWLDIVYWRDQQAATAAGEAIMQRPECGPFFSLMDDASTTMRHMTVLSAVS